MIIENLTQRQSEFQETKTNIKAVLNRLKNHPDELKACRVESTRHIEKLKNEYKEEITANDISEYLDKSSGAIIPKQIVIDYINILKNLDEDLQEITEKTHDKPKGTRESKEVLNMTQAVYLSRIEDKGEQKDLAKALKSANEQRVRDQGILITEYKKAEPEVKEKVRSGEIKLDDVPVENLKTSIKKKIEEVKKENKSSIIVTNYKQYQRQAKNEIGDTNYKLARTCAFLNGLSESGILLELDWEVMLKAVEAGQRGAESYAKFMNKIAEEIK